MRYRILMLIARRFPPRVWDWMPVRVREWWASEWMRRYQKDVETRRYGIGGNKF